MSDRLDQALVARGLAASRSQARDLVRRGEVRVEGVVVTRPATTVLPGTRLVISAEAARVSRGGAKLAAGLAAFALSAAGRHCLDLGASTGGFTQELLRGGALSVAAVDVGHGQLHATLRADPRVTALEGRDARSLGRADLRAPVAAVVADLSFISLTLALPPALALAAPGCWLVALVKPQFEAGREAVRRGGIVRDAADRERAVARVGAWLRAQPGWRMIGVVPSPLEGGAGNVEYLLGACHDA